MNTTSPKDALFSYPYWRQRIPLSASEYTPGYIHLSWDSLALPNSLQGMSFLDVGANDGFYSFEAERRNAAEVVAVDVYKELSDISPDEHACPRNGIDLVRRYLNSNVAVEARDIYDLSKMNRSFDFVILSNVIAWLHNPYSAIENLSAVTKKQLVIRDGFLTKHQNTSMMRYEPEAFNTYRMNLTFIKTLLLQHGFTKVEVVSTEPTPIDERNHSGLVNLKANYPVYKHFNDQHELNSGSGSKGISLDIQNGRHLIRKEGWVPQEFVEPIHISSSMSSRFIRSLIGSDRYLKLKTRYFDMRSDVKEFVIVAEK